VIFGAAVNAFLVTAISLHLDRTGDPYRGQIGVLWLLGVLGVPVAAIIALIPVIAVGRDVPRLLAIGLSVLPVYVVAVGLGQLFSIMGS
jgi:hypothetical protein